MSMYDIFMLVVLGGAIFLGMWKGLAWQVASLVSIGLSYFVASNFWPVLAPKISVDPPLNEFIAMFVLFLGTALAVWIVFGIVRKSIEKMSLKSWDRQAGAVVGGIKGIALCMVITLFAVTLLGENNKRAIINSTSGRLITTAINKVAVAVPANMREKIDSYLKEYNIEVEKHHDPNETGAPFGDTLNDFVESTLDKAKTLTGGQGSGDEGVGPRSAELPGNGTFPNFPGTGNQVNSQPYNSPGNTSPGYTPNYTSGFEQTPGYGQQGNDYEAEVITGESSNGGLYFDVISGTWIQTTPQNETRDFSWQEAVDSVRDQISDTVTENLRDAVNDRLKGKR